MNDNFGATVMTVRQSLSTGILSTFSLTLLTIRRDFEREREPKRAFDPFITIRFRLITVKPSCLLIFVVPNDSVTCQSHCARIE